MGTRLAPLAAALGVLAIAEGVAWLPGSSSLVVYPIYVAADFAFAAAILSTAESRDFS
jgi:hypothetical protein